MNKQEITSQVRNARSPQKACEDGLVPDKYTVLGKGSARLVIQYTDNTVLKIAVNSGGRIQNYTEQFLWNNSSDKASKYLAPVEDVDEEQYEWLEMKMVENPRDSYGALVTDDEKHVFNNLIRHGIELKEVETGRFDGRIVAFDYGNATPDTVQTKNKDILN